MSPTPRLGRRGLQAPRHDDLECLCWCEAETLYVRIEAIRAGRTESCGRPGCQPPAVAGDGITAGSRSRRAMRRGRITPGDGDPRHGTTNGYGNLGCRCASCREANTAHVREWRSGGCVRSTVATSTCPMCGPFTLGRGRNGIDECPTCEMTPGEHAYRLRILADSDAVLREEVRAYRAKRDAERRTA
jgi:ribosomal protein L37AE/L43A